MADSVKTVADVLTRLTAIDAALPPSDGVKWFNRLYLEMTQQVETAMVGRHFDAPGYLEALDVVFARRYFAALDAAGAGKSLPPTTPSTPGSRCSNPVSRPVSPPSNLPSPA